MGSAVYEFVTSAPVEAAIFTILTSLASAVAAQHPKVSGILAAILLFFKKKTPPVATFFIATVLGLMTAGSVGADDHPPIGTIVTAKDTGKQMRHTGNGHFVEVGVPTQMPTAKFKPCPCVSTRDCGCETSGVCTCKAYCSCPDCPGKSKPFLPWWFPQTAGQQFPPGGLQSGPAILGTKPVTIPLKPVFQPQMRYQPQTCPNGNCSPFR